MQGPTEEVTGGSFNQTDNKIIIIHSSECQGFIFRTQFLCSLHIHVVGFFTKTESPLVALKTKSQNDITNKSYFLFKPGANALW